MKTYEEMEALWKKEILDPHLKKNENRYKGRSFTSISDMEVPLVSTKSDIEKINIGKDISFPGQFPYTRGNPARYVPGKSLDHATVCRFWHSQAHQ